MLATMKVAIVHELLTMRGGAERVAKVFADLFPEAPVYTLLYDQAKLGDWFPAARVRPSRLQPGTHFTTNHHAYLPFFSWAVEQWDFSDFDLVLSSSSAFVHGLRTKPHTKHVCYVHSPARYLWDRATDVRQAASEGWLGSLRGAGLGWLQHRLRQWDAEAAQQPATLFAASREVQRRIELYWRRESTVLCPPIADAWCEGDLPATRSNDLPFLTVSTLARYKRLDLAVQACSALNLPLRIVGDGPDHARLQALAGPSVQFLGHQDHAQLRQLYATSRALLFPGDEDFGLVGIEAMACGLPVIAYHSGGACEWLHAGITGTFFDEPTIACLRETLRTFDATSFTPSAGRAAAEQYRQSHFESKLRNVLGCQ
jgi:glycosyltransferase involved in cell wall biosynthesis